MPLNKEALELLRDMSPEEQDQAFQLLSETEQDDVIRYFEDPESYAPYHGTRKEKFIRAIGSIKDVPGATQEFFQTLTEMPVSSRLIRAALKKVSPKLKASLEEIEKLEEESGYQNIRAATKLAKAGGISLPTAIASPGLYATEALTRGAGEYVEEGKVSPMTKLEMGLASLPAIKPITTPVRALLGKSKEAKALSRIAATHKAAKQPNKIVQRLLGLTRKVARKEIDPVHAAEITETVISTPGKTLKAVGDNLAAKGVEYQNILKKVYDKATQFSKGRKIVDMKQVATDIENMGGQLTKELSSTGEFLIKEAKQLSKQIKQGKVPQFKNPKEAWVVLKNWGKEAKYDPILSSAANNAKIIKRGILKQAVQEQIEKQAAPVLANRLRQVNKAASANLDAQATLMATPEHLSKLTPTTREAVMLGLGGLAKKGTLGTLAGVGYTSHLAAPAAFAGVKTARKIKAQLPKVMRLGRRAGDIGRQIPAMQIGRGAAAFGRKVPLIFE
jgi:hypothetical protein